MLDQENKEEERKIEVDADDDVQDQKEDEVSVHQTEDPDNPVRVEIPEPRENRKARRQREAEERTNRRVSEAVGPLQQQLAEMRAMLAALGQNTQRPAQPARGQLEEQDDDPTYLDFVDRQQGLLKQLAAETDPTERKRLERALIKHDAKRQEYLVERVMKRSTPQQQGPNEVEMRSAYKRSELQSLYPEVFNSPKALRHAQYLRDVAREEAMEQGLPPPTLEDEKRFCQEALTKFSLRRDMPARPSASQQAKFGPPDSRPGSKTGNAWVPTPQQRSLAWEYAGGPGITAEQAIAKWYKEVGKPNNLV